MPLFPRLAAFGCAFALASPGAAAQPLSAEEAAALREEVRALRARLSTIEARLGGPDPTPPTPAGTPAVAPTITSWKGSPQWISEDRAFKVKGRLQADIGQVWRPKGLSDRGLGTSVEYRRIRLGGEGKLGSGFGYKLELELSDNKVDLVDSFITYEHGPWQVALGNQNSLQSLDELTGDTSGSLMERAAFTDAFNFERRLGATVQYRHKDLLLQAGLFSDDITALANDSDGAAGGDENNSYGLDGRIVYAPKIGGVQTHFGASAHRRWLNRLADSPVRYRQRPYLHTSNSRLIGTPALTVSRETHYGAELAGISGPWHAVGEVHWLEAATAGPNPRFFGGYAEVGYFLTKGDSRAYRNGIFGATKPASPLGKGGIGAIQINLRYDYLDLNDARAAIRGGRQNAFLAAIIWAPIENLRFNLNHGWLDYSDAPTLAGGRDDYGLHVTGARFELDF